MAGAPAMPPPRLHIRFDSDGSTRKENRQCWKFFLEAWSSYSEKSNVKTQPPDARLATFLSCLGSEAIEVYNEMAFDNPEDRQDLGKIVSKFNQYFSLNCNGQPRVSAVSSILQVRYGFHTRMQQQGETLEQFVCAVKALAERCYFCNCAKDGLVRDQILLGMGDEGLRQRLLQEEDISLEVLLEVCYMNGLISWSSGSSVCKDSTQQDQALLEMAATTLPLQGIHLNAGPLTCAPSTPMQSSGMVPPCSSAIPMSFNPGSSLPVGTLPPLPENMQCPAPVSNENSQNSLVPAASNGCLQSSMASLSSTPTLTSSANLPLKTMHHTSSEGCRASQQAALSQKVQQVSDGMGQNLQQSLWQSSQGMQQAALESSQPLLQISSNGSHLLQQLPTQSNQSLLQGPLGNSQGLQQVAVGSESGLLVEEGRSLGMHHMTSSGGQLVQLSHFPNSTDLQQASLGSSQGLLHGSSHTQQATLGRSCDLQQVSFPNNQNFRPAPLESAGPVQPGGLGPLDSSGSGRPAGRAGDVWDGDRVEAWEAGEEDADELSSKDTAGNGSSAADLAEDVSTWPACDICGKKFLTIKKVNRHKFVHRQKYRCSLCLQELQGLKQYQQHQAQHATAPSPCLPPPLAEAQGQPGEEGRVEGDAAELPGGGMEEEAMTVGPAALAGAPRSPVSESSKCRTCLATFPDQRALQAGHPDPASPRDSSACRELPPESEREAPLLPGDDAPLCLKRPADTGSGDQQSEGTSALPSRKGRRERRGKDGQGLRSAGASLDRRGSSYREVARDPQLADSKDAQATSTASSSTASSGTTSSSRGRAARRSRASRCRSSQPSRSQATGAEGAAATLTTTTAPRDGSSQPSKRRKKTERSQGTLTPGTKQGEGDRSARGSADDPGSGKNGNDSSSSQGSRSKPEKDQRLYKCGDCGKAYRESRNLRIHRAANCLGEQGNPHCSHCGKVYTSLKRLQNHILSHHPDDTPTDGKDSLGSDQVPRPVRKYSDFNRSVCQRNLKPADKGEASKFACKLCPKLFRNPWTRQYHVQQIHERLFTCSKCDVVSKGRDDHQAHLRTHVKTKVGEKSKMAVCRECGKVCGSYYHLKKHMASVHRGETTPCDVCGKKFVDKNYLNYHKVIHTGEMPYWCNLCNKGFKLVQGYKYHMRKHDGTSPYTCEYCGASFYQMSHLKYHIRAHTNERPHACPECGKKFLTSSSLKRHAFVHTEERNSICELCGRGYKCEKYLQVHMKTHEKESKNAPL